jgi:hypothetical protein
VYIHAIGWIGREDRHRSLRLEIDYRHFIPLQVNKYSTEAAYRVGPREVDYERTEAIIQMTFTEERSSETLPNAESRDSEICICHTQGGFPRAEAHSSHGEYDHLL